MQGPEVVSKQGLHHGEGDGSALVNSVTGDLPDTVRDILQANRDGVTLGIHHFCSDGCYIEEGLDLRFQG